MGKSVKNLGFKFRVKLRCQRLRKRGRAASRRPVRPSCTLFESATLRSLTSHQGRRSHRQACLRLQGPLDATKRAWCPVTPTRSTLKVYAYHAPITSVNPSHAYRTCLNFGMAGLMTRDYEKLPQSCLNVMHQAARRELPRRTPLHVRVAADRPVTTRPAESRMGKGKGALAYWEAALKPGAVLFEVCDMRHDPKRLMAALGKKTRLRLKLLR